MHQSQSLINSLRLLFDTDFVQGLRRGHVPHGSNRDVARHALVTAAIDVRTVHALHDGFVAFHDLGKAGVGFSGILVAALAARTVIFGVIFCVYVEIRTTWPSRVAQGVFDVRKVGRTEFRALWRAKW